MRHAAFLLPALVVLAIVLSTTSRAQSGPERVDPIKELMPRTPPQGDFWRPEELRRLHGDPVVPAVPAPEPPVPTPPAKTR